MERLQEVATLTAHEWYLVHEGFMPAARANAALGTYGSYGSLAGEHWAFWHAEDTEAGTDGLVAICTGQDGSVTSYAVNPADSSIKRVHVSADVPDLKWSFGGAFADLGAALAEQDEDTSIEDLFGHIGFQMDLGLDVPVGDELQPLKDVMAEAAALYGIDPDHTVTAAPGGGHVAGSVFSPTVR